MSRSEGSVLRAPVVPAQGVHDDTLVAGEVLTAGGQLREPTGAYTALMCEDGKFVVLRVDDSTPTWASHTHGHANALILMKDDGELAIHTPDGQRLWSSPTSGNPGAFVQLHEDGRLAIYGFYRDLLWSSNATT